MDREARLASAPVSWGVWERTIARDGLVTPEQLLAAVRSLGYRAIELGPLGYLGRDPRGVRATLDAYGLELAGAFVLLHLTDAAAFEADLVELERTLTILEAFSTPIGLLADAGSVERARAAGKPAELRRTSLTGRALTRAADRLARAAERCRRHGIAAALHPEASSYAEAPQEVAAFLDRLDPGLLGLCLDTGHILVGGGDPVEVARAHESRIEHVHVKDVDETVLARLRAGELDVDAAWSAGLFCALGDGVVDLAGALATPPVRAGENWIVLEQDRVHVRARDLASVQAVEGRNLELVRDLIREDLR